jgi:hypothetical protein
MLHPRKTVEAVDSGARPQVRADDPAKPAEFNPAGFSFAFAGRGEILTVRFKLMLLGADAPSEASLAAHRCSNLL